MSIKKLCSLFVAALITAMLASCGGGGSSTALLPGTTTIPVAPLSLAVESGDTVNTVTWPAVPGATSYDLYWSETTPVTITSATVIENAVSPYLHTGLTNGKMIYYAVASKNAAGKSGLSQEVGAMAMRQGSAGPSVVNATPGNGRNSVSWSPVSKATHYNLYWSLQSGVKPGGAGVTKIENISGTSFTHLGLTNDTTYYYVVTAVSSDGEGSPSKEVSARPSPAASGAPRNFVATSGDTAITLSWSESLDATSYNVYWSKTSPVVPGAAGVTQVSGITTTSYAHTGLTNGDTYYYVVTSVGSGGESEPSSGVSSRPLPPPPRAPIGLSAVSARDKAQITVQWFDVTGYPSETAPVQPKYNVYRGLTSDLASYYKDASRANKIENATAPLIDENVVTGTTYYYVVTASHPTYGSDTESVPSGVVSAKAGPGSGSGQGGGGSGSGGGGGGEGGGGETEESFGSNLSFPVVFADGYGVTGAKIAGTWQGLGPFSTLPTFDFNTGVRPLSTEALSAFPYLDSSTSVQINSVVYYPQGSPSTWQAEWRSNADGAQTDVILDWGDSLISRHFTTTSMIRIETVLFQDATVPGITDTMKAYKMTLLSGSGTTELQGTDGTTYDSARRNVFAVNGRLTIEKLDSSGSGSEVIFDKAIYEGFGTTEEGSEGGSSGEGGSAPVMPYAAEINQSGSVVYGYNFFLSKTSLADKAGQYRITFTLDPQATIGGVTVPNHTKIVGKADSAATISADGMSSSVIVNVSQ